VSARFPEATSAEKIPKRRCREVNRRRLIRTEGRISVDAGLPLKAGEVLWNTPQMFSKLNKRGNSEVAELPGGGNFYWERAPGIYRRFAHTLNPLRMVSNLMISSIPTVDAATLASLQYEMHPERTWTKKWSPSSA